MIYLLSKAPGKKSILYNPAELCAIIIFKICSIATFKKNISGIKPLKRYTKVNSAILKYLEFLLFSNELAISNSSISLRKLNLSVTESSYIILSVIEILSIVIAS